MEEKKNVVFTSPMSRFERAAALGYIPVHIFLLPWLLIRIFGREALSEMTLNAVCYIAAALVLFLCLRRFFRRGPRHVERTVGERDALDARDASAADD